MSCELTLEKTTLDSIGNDRVQNNSIVLVKERRFLEVFVLHSTCGEC